MTRMLVVPLTTSIVLKSVYWVFVLLHDFWISQKFLYYWIHNIEHLGVIETLTKLKWNALGQKKKTIHCASLLESYFPLVKLAMTVW